MPCASSGSQWNKYAMPCAATSLSPQFDTVGKRYFFFKKKKRNAFIIGKVGRTHNCNNNFCGRKLITGQDRIEGLNQRFCLACGYKKMKEMEKMIVRNIKEIEETHLKDIVTMRIIG